MVALTRQLKPEERMASLLTESDDLWDACLELAIALEADYPQESMSQLLDRAMAAIGNRFGWS
jgi:hypothetical protein